MGVGHATVGLGAAKGAPRVNVGWLVFGSFLADFLLGIFALMGLEQAHVPADYASRHYPYLYISVFAWLGAPVICGALFAVSCFPHRNIRAKARFPGWRGGGTFPFHSRWARARHRSAPSRERLAEIWPGALETHVD
jgi:hypothetical protein